MNTTHETREARQALFPAEAVRYADEMNAYEERQRAAKNALFSALHAEYCASFERPIVSVPASLFSRVIGFFG